MGCKSIIAYARSKRLRQLVCLAEIADAHRRKTGEEPVIVVDGVQCVQYLYGRGDTFCGGQYKQFREKCHNFVEAFRNCGVRLVFFFRGLIPAEKYERWEQVSRDNVAKINQMLKDLPISDRKTVSPARLPEGLIPCAQVIFRDEPSTEVHLSMADYNREMAHYAASCKNCLGVMSRNGNFLIYEGVSCMFTFGEKMQIRNGVRMLCFRSSVIASHLGITLKDMPGLATFLGNDAITSDELQHVHEQLGSTSECVEKLVPLVAKLVKNRTVEEVCQEAFGDRWREFLESVKAGIGQYEYKPRAPDGDVKKDSSWSVLLENIEAKHTCGEIPASVLSVARNRTFRIGEVLEDLSGTENAGPSTGEALRPMRRRMYTVLLWESGDGPFCVEEQVPTSTDRYQQHVEVEKRLPPNVDHPGLLELWSGDEDIRWRLFSWIVGAPNPDGSALRSLEPQCLVVPAAALYFLRHEAHLLERREAEVFAVVAVTVGSLTPQQLNQKISSPLDLRAIFLSTLFVRTVLHVLDAAAVCGLSFPREADCQLDAYFDGKYFHELYLKAQKQSFTGTLASCDPTYLHTVHKFLAVIDKHTDRE